MKKCILVYDDELEILNICRLVLKKHDYQVEVRVTCSDILSDVDLIKPDLIFMDLWIPEIGGAKAITLLKNSRRTRNIPVILFSADSGIKAICHQIKAEGYLEKPFGIHELVDIAEKYVR
jgi:CheY-like chemotaxis protein